jgi:hypothetical protein
MSRAFHVAALMAFFCSLPIGAQTLKYANEQEIYGAAAASPDSTRQVVRRLISFCEGYDQSLQASGESAMTSWTSRHAAYLAENAEIRAHWVAASNDPKVPATTRAAIKNMFDQVLPKTIDSQFESFATPIRTMSPQSTQVEMCKSYVKAISEREFDLQKNDPTLAAWFDKRIAAKVMK